MKVTSKKTVDFPKFRWGIKAGESRDLPEDKTVQDTILAHPAIEKVDKGSDSSTAKKSKEEGESTTV